MVERKICEDVEKSFVSYVPDEHCELEPYEVCNFVQKQYPTLVEEEFCKTVPRETCDPERVLPKQETKPLIKKVCKEDPNGMGMGMGTTGPGTQCGKMKKLLSPKSMLCQVDYLEIILNTYTYLVNPLLLRNFCKISM